MLLRTKNLGRNGRNVINVSTSGARIVDFIDITRNFYEDNPYAKKDDIEKVIFSLGTNDVKSFRPGVNHLRKYLIGLIDTVKGLFPAATVIFQSCLPIRGVQPHIPINVVKFNELLRGLCSENNCVYLDCFRDFLSNDLCEENSYLYHDWLHLNKRGVNILSLWFKSVINTNSFNYIVSKRASVF